MKSLSAISTVLAAASFFVGSALADVDPIVIKGSKFFYKTNGTQFFIKGVAYQQDYGAGGNTSVSGSSGSNGASYVDPLASPSNCQRDIAYLQQLGTNTIRVYAVDPSADHSQCMSMLANAGIYVIADLSSPGSSIIRDSPQWTSDLYTRYTSVIDSLAQYNNVLGFFAGNEVSNNNTNTDASAFVKAAVRDMKSYIKQKKYRTIGVGYATNDDASIRVNMADYFDCGNRDDAIDFWGYNIYSWCGNSSYTESGYDQRTAEFASYNVPAFFAEYGCNTVQPRTFSEVGTLFGSQMTSVWSGGIVYMYFQEANDYGLVSVSGNSVSTLDDFNYLSSQIAAVTPSGVNSGSYNPTNTAAASCPSVGTAWQAASNLPPTPNSQLCNCMYNALSCVPHNVGNDSISSLFGYICGQSPSACQGIAANGTSGTYGAYGMCSPSQQLGWAMNAYYTQQVAAGNGASACAFSGSATLKSATTATGTCATLINQAGQNGQGTVTSQATGTSGSSSGSSSKSAGTPGLSTPSNFGLMQAVAFLSVAFASGAGMIFL